MVEMRVHTEFQMELLKENNTLRDLDADGNILLTLMKVVV
jgi:hypothetical protein